MVFVFLGPPGSGKGTQAKILQQNKSFVHLSTGDMLRSAVSEGSELGKRVKSIMEQGLLVSDDIVLDLIRDQIKRHKSAPGIILDGYPRNVAQARALDGVLKSENISLTSVLSFNVDEALLVERIVGRRSCPKCGASYHIKFNPPKRSGVCDHCGFAGVFTHRTDDTEVVIRGRLKVYNDQTSALKSYYGDMDRLIDVEADLPPKAVTNKISEAIGLTP